MRIQIRTPVSYINAASSVADPDPNPDPDQPDPHVYGPPGSGSGSFYHHAKIIRKTLIPTIFDSFWLFIFEKLSKCTFKK
jgi:hypothetical protein